MPDLQHLTALLASPDSVVRRNGVNAIDYEAAPEAVFAIAITLLQDADPQVRATAASLLDLINSTDANEPLLEMLKSEADEDAYEAGCTTLSRFASPKICAFFRQVSSCVFFTTPRWLPRRSPRIAPSVRSRSARPFREADASPLPKRARFVRRPATK